MIPSPTARPRLLHPQRTSESTLKQVTLTEGVRAKYLPPYPKTLQAHRPDLRGLASPVLRCRMPRS
jgi:hypothetical protein